MAGHWFACSCATPLHADCVAHEVASAGTLALEGVYAACPVCGADFRGPACTEVRVELRDCPRGVRTEPAAWQAFRQAYPEVWIEWVVSNTPLPLSFVDVCCCRAAQTRLRLCND